MTVIELQAWLCVMLSVKRLYVDSDTGEWVCVFDDEPTTVVRAIDSAAMKQALQAIVDNQANMIAKEVA